MRSALSGTQWTISDGSDEAVVVEVGGGLRTYRRDGEDVIDGYGADELCPAGAGQVLAPWPNRVRDGEYTFDGQEYHLDLSEPAQHNAIHGLVRWAPWRAEAVTQRSVTLAWDLPAQPGYPWPLRLTTTWSLGADGLTATHMATNTSDRECPFGLGVHPYVTIPGVPVDELMVTVPATSRLLTDARGLPIGAAKLAGSEYDYTAPRQIGAAMLDTAFGGGPDGAGRVEVDTADGSRTVTVWADKAFRWWQLFTADPLPAPRTRRSVAVEPMTCPPDALRSGRDLIRLAPGQTWRASWGITPGGER